MPKYVNYKKKEESLQKKYNVFHPGRLRGKHDKIFCSVCEYSNDEVCFYDTLSGVDKTVRKYPCARAWHKYNSQNGGK